MAEAVAKRDIPKSLLEKVSKILQMHLACVCIITNCFPMQSSLSVHYYLS